jgi:hypothetical protein
MHFITDSDRGYSLKDIRAISGTSLIYSELHERPTDEHPQGVLPALAVMRSRADLPTTGRPFNAEIVTNDVRGTVILSTGTVEVVSEDPSPLTI